MKTEEVDNKIGMPDVDAEWANFKQNVIENSTTEPTSHTRENGMRKMVAAIFIGVFCLGGVVLASVFHQRESRDKKFEVDQSVETMPMVVYYRSNCSTNFCGYSVSMCPGTWVSRNDSSWLEEKDFEYFFWETWKNRKCTVTMMLDGCVFDTTCMPHLVNKDLKKVEITSSKDSVTVNLVTKDQLVPIGVRGNLPREITILLPGGGRIYFTDKEAQEGNWMNCCSTTWKSAGGGWSIIEELGKVKEVPGLKVYVYSSNETKQTDIDRATRVLSDIGISNVVYRKNIPIKHFSDQELRQWAKQEKTKGTKFAELYNKMAPNGMDVSDVSRQWHIVKEVYGVK